MNESWGVNMTALFLFGFLAFVFSFLYLLFHFIRKIKDKERKFSRKLFFPLFTGGFLFFIIGGVFMDTGVQEQLDAASESNTNLAAENKELESEYKELQENYDKLVKDNEKVNGELKAVSDKVSTTEKVEQDLKEQQTAFQTEKDELNNQITSLKAENESLLSKIDNLNTELADKSATNTAAPSSSNISSNSSSSIQQASTSNEAEFFKNCTELTKKYPNGVPSTHPAYQSKMDRDKDNFACER